MRRLRRGEHAGTSQASERNEEGDKTAFITGDTRWIGRVLIKELVKTGQRVKVPARASSNRTGLDLPGVEVVTGDVTDAEAARRGMAGCERLPPSSDCGLSCA